MYCWGMSRRTSEYRVRGDLRELMRRRYQLLSPEGTLLGYLMEEELGMRGTITRQLLKTHRAFKATVLDTEGNVLLRVRPLSPPSSLSRTLLTLRTAQIRRPFSWINSRIYISTPLASDPEADDNVIGEAQQVWHLYRRQYNQFVKRGEEGEMVQFGSTDSGFLAWDFFVKNEAGDTIGSINRFVRRLTVQLRCAKTP